MITKTSGNCKVPEELFKNSAANGKDHASSELKDSESGASFSNESTDCRDNISNTSEGDNAAPRKDIETSYSANGPGLITKKQPPNMVFPAQWFEKRNII